MFPWDSFLTAIGALAAIAGVLALLVVLAEATIANYGRVKITINGEKELEVDGGRALLGTLMDEDIFIPSACGGRGSCGFCTLRVLEGAGDVLPTELPWLSKEEQQNQVRLSCQIKVKRDLAIEIPPELLLIKEFETEVESITDLTYDIKQVRLRLLEPDQIEFRAGQFMQFRVPEYELTDEPVYRAYSMASPPHDPQHLEFEIRLVPNGICTTYVHKHLKQGERVQVNGPYGDFGLRDTEREIVFIAGGSGMAPIKSILLDMERKQIGRRARYFFGARAVRDLFLVEEMKRLEQALSNFTFIPALSAPETDDNWQGDTGLITEVVERHLESGENVEAYLCGSPGMIKACVEVLTKKGVPDELIYYDSFG